MRWSAMTALSALLAAIAAALAVRSPSGEAVRTRVARSVPGGGRLASLLRERADAPSLRRRIGACAGGWAALVLLADGWGLDPIWPGAVAGGLAAGIAVVVLGRMEPLAARQRTRRLVSDLPQALELLAAALESGQPVGRAAVLVADAFDGPVAEDLQRLLTASRLGIPDAEAWRELRHHPQWGQAAADLARSADSGTMMVQALAQHARRARAARRAQLEVTAKSVGVRSVLPLMVCFLPAFMLLGIVPTVASALMAALS